MIFSDRSEAGRMLAGRLGHHRGRPDVIVLALPRGGVAVGFEVAKALGAPLDIFLVRKLGTPGNPELAMGAIGSGGVRVLNRDVIRAAGVSDAELEGTTRREQQELERRETEYRGDRPRPEVGDRTVILVDDGLATGASMRAAVRGLRQRAPAAIVVAVPTAPMDTAAEFEGMVDEMVCLSTPVPFFGVGGSYRDFSQMTDQQVRALLERAREDRGSS